MGRQKEKKSTKKLIEKSDRPQKKHMKSEIQSKQSCFAIHRNKNSTTEHELSSIYVKEEAEVSLAARDLDLILLMRFGNDRKRNKKNKREEETHKNGPCLINHERYTASE
ncbi:hypothetical protein CDAR_595321 [Caerostris darwini]|uniref:Uncharacterized protein n=1 Tax=Caerostris darwini TaxID=1538125 RepID=A0AAV4SJP0_9ARAC|nr:hypothetical protein CDAR_595321 [Caerostris darwini]